MLSWLLLPGKETSIWSLFIRVRVFTELHWGCSKDHNYRTLSVSSLSKWPLMTKSEKLGAIEKTVPRTSYKLIEAFKFLSNYFTWILPWIKSFLVDVCTVSVVDYTWIKLIALDAHFNISEFSDPLKTSHQKLDQRHALHCCERLILCPSAPGSFFSYLRWS
jgi:hypothetical protein